MATPYNIHVKPHESGLLRFPQDDASADKVSELLQKDLENHHVFFNTEGFHNHIPHHLLTLYGTGAGSSALQAAFSKNASYQIRASTPKSSIVEELQADYPAAAPKYLGKGKHYAAFLRFFQAEMETKSWQDVLQEYVFKEDDATAKDLYERLFAGFLHPMIQLMFGVEWQQPAILAEGLAQAAVHDNWLGGFLAEAEKRAEQRESVTYRPLTELFEELHDKRHEKLARSARLDDSQKIRDGVMARAPEEALDYVSQIKVRPEELEERTAEMAHNAAYIAAASSWHPPHIPKYDFFLIHHLNAFPIFLTINEQDWIPTALKVRFLEWKMRIDVIQYIARGCPQLHPEALHSFALKDGTAVSEPKELLPRFHNIMDDGHTIKVARALLLAQEQTNKFGENRPWLRIKGDDWLRAHYLLLEGTEGEQDSNWVRSAGFEGAWKDIPRL